MPRRRSATRNSGNGASTDHAEEPARGQIRSRTSRPKATRASCADRSVRVALTAIGIGAIIGTGIFVLTGLAAAKHAGPAIVAVVHHRRHRLRLRRPVLRRVRLDDPRLRQRLRVLLRDARRSRRLVHRLEPGARIPVRGLDRRGRLVAATWSSCLDALGINFIPPALSSAPIDYTVEQGFFATGAIINLPAVLIVAVVTASACCGIRQSALTQRDRGRDQGRIVVLVIGFGAFYVDRRQLGIRSFRANTGVWGQFGWSGVIRALRHHLLRLHRLRRGVHGRAGSEESAARHADRHSRAASSSARCCTSLMSGVLTGMLAVSEAQRRGAGRDRAGGASASSWLIDLGDLRRARRPDLGDPGHDAGAVAHLLFDVARRPAAAALPAVHPAVANPGVLAPC